MTARVLSLLLACSSLASCAGSGGDRDLFERACSRCHPLSLPLGQSYDREGWERAVRRMSEYSRPMMGPIPPGRQREIVEYLLKNGKKP